MLNKQFNILYIKVLSDFTYYKIKKTDFKYLSRINILIILLFTKLYHTNYNQFLIHKYIQFHNIIIIV